MDGFVRCLIYWFHAADLGDGVDFALDDATLQFPWGLLHTGAPDGAGGDVGKRGDGFVSLGDAALGEERLVGAPNGAVLGEDEYARGKPVQAMRGGKLVVACHSAKANGGSLRDVAGARHRSHEGRLVDDQEVLVFVQDWDVVWDGCFGSRHAVEVHHRVGGEGAVGTKRGAVLGYNLVRCEAGLEGRVVVVGVAVTLGHDEVVHKVPRGDGAFGDACVGGV